MEDLCLHIPRDFESRMSFRLLESEVGRPTAYYWLVLLWRDLSYAAQNNPLGVLPPRHEDLLNRTLAEAYTSVRSAAGVDVPSTILLRCDNLLTRTDAGLYCELFAMTNAHLDPAHISMQRVGGKKRAVEAKAKQIEVEATQQAVLIDPDLFKRPDGSAMEADEVRRTVMVVRMIDQYLGQPSRLQRQYTRGLVQDAYRAIKTYTADDITRFCTWLSFQRESGRLQQHPAFPETTEEVLRDFDKLVHVKL